MFPWIFVLLIFGYYQQAFSQSCSHGRLLIQNATHGTISDGKHNYQSNQRCEWLIVSPEPQTLPVIMLQFTTKETECIFDNVVVNDGNSTKDKVLAVLSGDYSTTKSHRLFAYSGSMLISLYSDSNYEKRGFEATFQITSCPNNCSGSSNGRCIYNRCECLGSWTGEDCSVRSCDNNFSNNCNNGLCNKHRNRCMCNSNYIGKSCQTSVTNQEYANSWTFIVNDTNYRTLTALSGHSAVYLNSNLWIFGGYDLNQLYNSLLKYDFRENVWNTVYDLTGNTPSPRMQHTMNHLYHNNKDYFLILGGNLGNSTFSNELWLYNVFNNSWTQQPNAFKPVTQHASAIVGMNGDQFLYVFGGRISSENGFFFSSEMSRFSWNKKKWELVTPDPAGVSASAVKLAGHSMVYDRFSNNLVIFSGFTIPDTDALRSNKIILYNVELNHWQELNLLKPPNPMAFHTANIIGDYMVIYGGNIHIHNELEACYSNKLHLYHLRCHSWTQVDLPSDSPGGRFGHVSATVGQNSIIIHGGFDGKVLSDVWSYKVPEYAMKNLTNLCTIYTEINFCLLDQRCVWCDVACMPADKCEKKTLTTIQKPTCKGLCGTIKSCVSCASFSTYTYNTTIGEWTKEKCGWCVQDSKCYSVTNIPTSSLCDRGYPPSGTAWWGKDKGTVVTQVEGCVTDNLPPGLVAAQYHNDPLFTSPDKIYFLKKFLLQDIDVASGLFVVQVKGFLYTTSYIDSNISLSTLEGEGRISLDYENEDSQQITTIQADTYQTNITLIKSQKYFFNFTFTHTGDSSNYNPGGFLLQWYKNTKNTITSEFLEPFHSEPNLCQSYIDCMKCLTDFSCAWCSGLKQCENRADILSGKINCGPSSSLEFFGVVLDPISCSSCLDFVTCSSCLSNTGDCVWNIDGHCVRNKNNNKFASYLISDISSCPAPCHTLTSCGECLSGRNKTGVVRGSCLWCATTGRCYSDVYHLSSNPPGGECLYWLEDVNQCNECSLIKNCRECLNYFHCGWESSDEVLDGTCTNGDFGGPYNKSILNNQWFYLTCPAVNECVKEWPVGNVLHNCDKNASCIDLEPSYTCNCNPGFFGDGFVCNQTCLKSCGNGKCSGYPDYNCICDLGWTSNEENKEDCGVDCLCNFHSTCNTGVGICDKCYHNTTGDHCDTCQPGFYGTADVSQLGCQPCQCHGHGDMTHGTCHEATGDCLCLNNTEGRNCEKCNEGYYGNPRNNGVCFHNCNGRSLMMSSMNGAFGLNNTAKKSGAYCAWFIKTPEDHLAIKITILSDFYVSCLDKLNIYDGIYSPDNSTTSELIASLCGDTLNEEINLFAFSGYMTVMYENDYNNIGHFNTLYEICDCNIPGCCYEQICPFNCSEQGVCEKGICICNTGYIGKDCSISTNHLNIPYFWQPVINHGNLPLPTFGQSMVYNGDKLLIFGGMAVDGLTSELNSCNLMNQTCSKINSTLSPSGRYFHAAVFENKTNKMFVFGGIASDGLILNQLWTFHTNKGWILLPYSTNIPGLAGHTMTLFNHSNIIIIGGLTSQYNINYKVFDYDITNQQWSEIEVSGSRFRGAFGHTSIYDPLTRLIYVNGGQQGSPDSVVGQIDVYNPLKQRWTQIREPKGKAPTLRYFHTAVLNVKDNVRGFIIFGGRTEKNKFTNDLYLFRFGCNIWTNLNQDLSHLKEKLYAPNLGIGGSSVNVDNMLYVYGGSSNGLLSNKLKVLNLNSICFTTNNKQECKDLKAGCIICSSSNADLDKEEVLCLPSKENFLNDSLICDIKLNNPNQKTELTDPCLADQNISCDKFKNCLSCVAYTPPYQDDYCKWCSFGLNAADGGCFPVNHICNQSNAVQSELGCDECWSSICEECLTQPNCTWALNPLSKEWGCVVKKSLSHPFNPIPISNKEVKCPARCDLQTTCSSCVASDLCLWSSTFNLCVDPVASELFCLGGACKKKCDKFECGSTNYCLDCIQKSECGWGLGGGVGGVCMKGGFQGPLSATHVTQKMSWHYVSCPLENECETGHHTCVTTPPHFELCSDKDVGFDCNCQKGYKRKYEFGFCEPFCNPGCVNGECIAPDTCKCKFGFVGEYCQLVCQCNGFSACTQDNLNNCTLCLNNTKGSSCEFCKVGFVGDPTKHESCVPCETICNGRSQKCVTRQQNQVSLLSPQRPFTGSCTAGSEVSGPQSSSNVCCVNCTGHSQGNLCEECIDGYFMLNGVCRECDCNGHGTLCNRDNGAMCHCNNHTASSAESKCHNSPALLECWKKQCDKCEDNYAGNPAKGGQCYKEIGMGEELCFDSTSCVAPDRLGIPPLEVGRTTFFALHPQFTNVDIRLIVDVTEGEVDVFLSDLEDTFTIKVDPDTGFHSVVTATSNLTYLEGTLNDELSLARIVWAQTHRKLREVQVSDFNTYIEMKPTESLRAIGVRDRLVVTCPHDGYNLEQAKFYVILLAHEPPPVVDAGREKRALGGAQNARGRLLFRQDQTQIDLFVFFSVFFSCFFLFLSLCILVWKIKQTVDTQQARIAHHIQLQNMASRPFACICVYFDPPNQPSNKNNRKKMRQNNKGDYIVSKNTKGYHKVATDDAQSSMPLARRVFLTSVKPSASEESVSQDYTPFVTSSTLRGSNDVVTKPGTTKGNYATPEDARRYSGNLEDNSDDVTSDKQQRPLVAEHRIPLLNATTQYVTIVRDDVTGKSRLTPESNQSQETSFVRSKSGSPRYEKRARRKMRRCPFKFGPITYEPLCDVGAGVATVVLALPSGDSRTPTSVCLGSTLLNSKTLNLPHQTLDHNSSKVKYKIPFAKRF